MHPSWDKSIYTSSVQSVKQYNISYVSYLDLLSSYLGFSKNCLEQQKWATHVLFLDTDHVTFHAHPIGSTICSHSLLHCHSPTALMRYDLTQIVLFTRSIQIILICRYITEQITQTHLNLTVNGDTMIMVRQELFTGVKWSQRTYHSHGISARSQTPDEGETFHEHLAYQNLCNTHTTVSNKETFYDN